MTRTFLFTITFSLLGNFVYGAEGSLREGSAPPALNVPHFPDRMHAFVWRNWSVVDAKRLAKVLDTSADNVRRVATSMGLPERQPDRFPDKERIYITVIRRNWHLLPYDQLLVLLDMSAEQLAYSLREDDFLFIKLGSLKPKCEPLRYSSPDEKSRKRCAAIRAFVRKTFGAALEQPREARLQFVDTLSRVEPSAASAASKDKSARFSPRFVYSYFALYGDPLLNPELDPYPEGLLQKLSGLGVDGIWIHTVLRQLAPSPLFPEFGEDHAVRLASLQALVQRAARYGIGVYLYMNEPRAMPEAFFANRKKMQGAQEGDYFALCTSVPEVRQWLSDSLAHVFTNVPGLAGVFTITASENFTSCASHNRHTNCPNCKERTAAEIIVEVNTAIAAGVHRGNPQAKVLTWDWGWRDDWAPDIIRGLPKSAWLMSVSEWSKPISRGGVQSTVGEYSISAVGPGPRAKKHWALAKEAGLNTVAKVQMNVTWELSAVPYLPALDLIAEHCAGLSASGVDGLMLSWTLGGYPSPNLELVQQFEQDPPPTQEEALNAVARKHFGAAGAPYARKAWTAFSNAFREFPYNGSVVYRCPLQVGPANPLYGTPTGYASTMVGIPYDHVDGWRGPYPRGVFGDQFTKVAEGWEKGLDDLRRAAESAPKEKRNAAHAQLGLAQAAQLHFASVANQIRFTTARDALLATEPSLSPRERAVLIDRVKQTLASEIEIARKLFSLTCQDSRIGYEASNQYYYLPDDLIEKAINCRAILDRVPELYPSASN